MTISDNGLALTKSFEGLRLTAYRDVKGVLTIGYGHTGADVRPGMVITEPEATALLRRDMAVAEHTVNIGVRVPLTQNQFDALADFVFNAGTGSFLHSTLRELVNEGKFIEAAAQFSSWVHADGKIEPGLVRRRQAEAELFVNGFRPNSQC